MRAERRSHHYILAEGAHPARWEGRRDQPTAGPLIGCAEHKPDVMQTSAAAVTCPVPVFTDPVQFQFQNNPLIFQVNMKTIEFLMCVLLF